jgi:hypothetical protein
VVASERAKSPAPGFPGQPGPSSRFNGSALRAAELLSARLPIASDEQVFFCWMRLYVKRGHGKVRRSCGGHALL